MMFSQIAHKIFCKANTVYTWTIRIYMISCALLFSFLEVKSVAIDDLRQGGFLEYSQDLVQMFTLNQTLFERSTLACATACLEMHRQCFSFVYDERTKICTPGAYVHKTPKVDSLVAIPGVMYTDAAIDVDLNNFDVYFREDIIVYLHISSTKVNYEKASEICQELGGQLYTTREAAKYRLLVELIDGKYDGVWIGLNDLYEEGTFRWTDDNSTLTPEIGDLIWGKNQPDNHDNDQHCCFWWEHYNAVADWHCEKENYFACEFPVPYRY